MSGTIMLANEDCMQSWLSRRSHSVNSKLARLNSERSEPTSGQDWFAEIKSEAEGGSFERRGNVAVIKIFGALDYQYDLYSWLFDCSCYLGIMNSVNAAVVDPGIAKIVLWVNSCGGGFFGQIECSNAIFAARGSKEVVAVVDPEAASAGYWLASQATRISCLESGWVGSIGSQCGLTSYYRMLQESGIDKELIRASISPDKNLGVAFEPISDKAREERQRWADFAGDTFIMHIERGRNVTRKDVLDNFGQGTMFFAKDAKSRGMIDAIGCMQDELVQTQTAPSVQSNRVPIRNEQERLRATDL